MEENGNQYYCGVLNSTWMDRSHASNGSNKTHAQKECERKNRASLELFRTNDLDVVASQDIDIFWIILWTTKNEWQ